MNQYIFTASRLKNMYLIFLIIHSTNKIEYQIICLAKSKNYIVVNHTMLKLLGSLRLISFLNIINIFYFI